jgi:hypothetical protein
MLDVTYFIDEALFCLFGYDNKKDNCFCSAINPLEINDTSLHDQKVGVWSAISRKPIITPCSLITLSTLNIVKCFFVYSLDIWMRTKLSATASHRTVLLHTHLVFPWRYCALCLGQNYFKRAFGLHCRSILHPHIIICGGQWKAHLTKTIPPNSPWNEGSNPTEPSCVFANTWGGGISSICFKWWKYEKYTCINVDGLPEYTHRLQ